VVETTGFENRHAARYREFESPSLRTQKQTALYMDKRLIKFYDQHLAKHGVHSPEALAWRNDDSQSKRFRVLSEIGDLNGCSVLDEGCGLGDLYAFLQSRRVYTQYKGIDINEQLIMAARQKYPGVLFEVADFSEYVSERVDYVLSSGALTFGIPNAKQVYFEHIMKMYDLSKIGAAFNMLDDTFWRGDDTYVTYTVEEVYEFCSRLTDKITVRRDYTPEDFTFYLYH
jgi:trans-aconitate methyltransferase